LQHVDASSCMLSQSWWAYVKTVMEPSKLTENVLASEVMSKYF